LTVVLTPELREALDRMADRGMSEELIGGLPFLSWYFGNTLVVCSALS
jgi:hypothetical protein